MSLDLPLDIRINGKQRYFFSCFRSASYHALVVFNVANEIAHKFHLIRFVRNFSLYPKLFFECDHQFSNINYSASRS